MTARRAQKADLMAWVDDQIQLEEGVKYTLDRLARFADADCQAWAAVETLAEGCNKSVRTIQMRLRLLESLGLIVATGAFHKTGRGRGVPIYQLAPDVDGLGKRVQPVAPIPNKRVQPATDKGAACCTHIGTEGTEESAHADSARAREENLSPWVERIVAEWPADGLARTDADQIAVELAAIWQGGVHPARVLEAVRRWKAARKGDFAPALNRWLCEGRHRLFLPGVDWTPELAAKTHAVRTVGFTGPDDLRAAFVALHGEPAAVSFLDGCAWDLLERSLTPRTGVAFDWLERHARPLMKSQTVRLVDPRSSRSG